MYEAWDDVITEVTYHRIIEYDQRGNRVSVEASNSNGWSSSVKYSYDDGGRLKKITTYNSQNEVSEKLCVYTSENSYYIEPSYDSFFRFFDKEPFEKTKLVYSESTEKGITTKHTEYYSREKLVGEEIEKWMKNRISEFIYRKEGRGELRWVFEYR